MNLPEVLVDRVGRSYPRKNLYLKERADAEAAGETKREQELQAKKESHPYRVKLKLFHAAERAFLDELKKREPVSSGDPVLSQYNRRLYEAQQKVVFYAPYVALTYDAELAYRTAQKEAELLPEMIAEYREAQDDLRYAQKEGEQISDADEAAYRAEVEPQKAALKAAYEAREAEIQASYDEGLISRKARDNSRKVNKTQYRQGLESLDYRAPKRYNKELLRNIRHRIKQVRGTKENLLEEELSGIRRSVPVEVEHVSPLAPVLSFFFPGTGQLINGQKKKGLLMILLCLFIYGVAIPYALGFGNYQGNGIAGLISLGQHGRRVDRSIIFLIEGIIAVLLLVISAVVMILSAKDAAFVRRETLRGIRPNNWFETKRTISENGFPYFVNIPAILLILFITLVPVFTAILLSFTGMNPDHQSKFGWVGLDNYMTLFAARGLEGSLFWRILVWTILWTLAATTLAIAVGMGLAILVNNRHIRGKRFFRTVYILPWAVPAFITIMFFSIMLSNNGYLTEVISSLAGRTVNVKNSIPLTRLALIVIQVWCGNAYVFLLSTGVLQSIPEDLYEAADIDGASSFQRLVHITLPMMLFQTAPILVGQYTFNFNNYTIIDLFNGGGPFNPSVYGRLAGGSDLLISYIFKLTMDNQYQALGAAISILISIVLIVIAFVGYRQTAAFKEA